MINSIKGAYCAEQSSLLVLKCDTIIFGGIGELFIIELGTFIINNFRIEIIHSLVDLGKEKILLGNNKRFILTFDLAFKQIINIFKGHERFVSCSVIEQEKESKIYSSSFYGSIKIWVFCLDSK